MSAKEVQPRLGRGLASLLGEAPASATLGASSPQGPAEIAIEMLEPGPFQPRTNMDPANLAELADSIRIRGILQPMLARPHPNKPGHYQIIAGERRWRASQIAGRHTVPVLVRSLSDLEAMAAALVENLQRQDLDAIEEAEGYQRLVTEFGETQEKLAEAIGKSRSHIANTMRLLNLPLAVKAEVRQGRLSAGHARAVLGHPDPAAFAQEVIARGWNVRQTEAAVKKATTPSPVRVAPEGTDAETSALERNLSDQLGFKVEVKFNGSGGYVKINYRDLEQLDSIVAALSRSG